MRNTKLYFLISKLDRLDQNRCRKFLLSPYFNKSKEIVKLFEEIIHHINGNTDLPLEKEKVWQRIIDSSSDFDDVRYRKYVSDLAKLIRKYLIQEEFENREIEQVGLFNLAIKERQLEKLKKGNLKLGDKISQKLPLSTDFYLANFFLENSIYEVEYADSPNRDRKPNFEQLMDKLDEFYLSEKLKIYCNILSSKTLSNYEYSVTFVEPVLDYVKKNLESLNIVIQLYYRIYLTYTQHDNIENYIELKKLLNLNVARLDFLEARRLYYYSLNYCLRRVNLGDQNFQKEVFYLYCDMIKNSIVFLNGELSPSDFKNIVAISTIIKEFEWAKKFIKQYANKLPERNRENDVPYNLARIHFMQKEYDEVISLLSRVEYPDYNYNINSKTMLLMTYYDTDQFDPLDSLLESFRVYLNRHKEIPDKRKTYFKNLIKFTKKLTKIIPGDKAAVQKLKKEIEETPGFRIKWLNEKITELGG